ncbi:heme peroxidase-domain-containing protein [Bombardia bombarda]|uniref:Heme peroxidase-domain-containing protein n=1 Tax=Bombardia bombarda TaxID=252184 RepID=A0AA40BWF7_9PEZI|nr:heme peroxidase-domain-containing protein [Bombardia bombarda]
MSSESQRPFANGQGSREPRQSAIDKLNEELKSSKYVAAFHGDALIGDKVAPTEGILNDIRNIFTLKNAPGIADVVAKYLAGKGLDIKAGAELIASMSNDSEARARFIEGQVKTKYDRMLHPPLTYLGDAFKYRAADGRLNSALNPHLGQAGAPYAKTVPSKTHPLGALPDPGDIFDRLMARSLDPAGRESSSGLSSMLIYHATIIIHDIFRTNDTDKSISDSSSYLDLSPLYGFTDEMQRKVRDDEYRLGLLKPDTFAEDRLLRQPPGVCIMLVMYNRYHNYAATQLRRINENGRFSVPAKYSGAKLIKAADFFVTDKLDPAFKQALDEFRKINSVFEGNKRNSTPDYEKASDALKVFIDRAEPDSKKTQAFYDGWEAAWDKLDDDLFHTARLITCGIYIQISIHDYLRALMGFHQYDNNFTLDPRVNTTEAKNVSRGLGNQVTVEFNLLYRFHCAISLKDEHYAEDFMREYFGKLDDPTWNPKTMDLPQFMLLMNQARMADAGKKPVEPCKQTFGLQHNQDLCFKRNEITGLFDDQQMITQLQKDMDDKISNFGPRNVPRSLKAVEVLGILQARKWEVGTLNDFRDFFGLKRHETFESITKHVEVQNALRDLYEHPDKVELYPGIFCESSEEMDADPGPSDVDSALWAAIFSDAITLVRSDRFYTVDWNTNSLTSWGMKEVTPDNGVLKSSVFHRLIQRAFPEWFPYDSVRFFHPFYTAEKNAQLAREQGYSADFQMDVKAITRRKWFGCPKTEYIIDTNASNPCKPSKPKYLYKADEIKALLGDTADVIVHPARLRIADLPPKIVEVLVPGQHKEVPTAGQGHEVNPDTVALATYFSTLTRDIIMREFITMNTDGPNGPVYQIDITRDFAIPVTTRYVADFLGFGYLVRSEANPSGKYSENEIYQHITNCQVYLAYNADETKLLKRRKAFKESIGFLFELTLKKGNIAKASKLFITRQIQTLGRWLWACGKVRNNPMTELGLKIAQQILENEHDSGRSAAILLLIGLDSAYNSVLAFTSVLNLFIKGLYQQAAQYQTDIAGHVAIVNIKPCDWLEVQKLALADAETQEMKMANDEKIRTHVFVAQRASIKLPIIRKAVEDHTVVDANKNPLFTVKRGQTVICDIVWFDEHWETEYLAYRSSFTEKFASYHPKDVAVLGLTAMVKLLAQMKNLRRGHDTQGRLKSIQLDASNETYSNFMAPERIRKIKHDVQQKIDGARDSKTAEDKWHGVFNAKEIMHPETVTYLTPEWDEMIPFPTTWKVRFDGFGVSNYGGLDKGLPCLTSTLHPDDFPRHYNHLKTSLLPDDFPPFYDLPGGPGHTGGSFAQPVCPCAGANCCCGKSGRTAGGKTENGLVLDHLTGITSGCAQKLSTRESDRDNRSQHIPESVIKPWKLPPQQTYIFTRANVVEPVEGVLIRNADVKISGGQIDYVRKHQPALPSPRPSKVIQVDLEGKFICPGLIDCHVHISAVPGESGLEGPASNSRLDAAVSLLRQPFLCSQMLSRGFTTVRDTGGATLALKEALADGVFPGPRLFMANQALSQTGGHGDRRGAHESSPPCGGGGLSAVCDGVPECTRAAREQLRKGADFIKIMAGGGVASPTDRLENTQFTAAEVRAICEVAESYGTWVTAHAYTPRAIRHAVDNGVTGIEHGNFIDQDTARYMADKGVWLTPTLVTYDAMASDKYPGFLPPENQRKNEEVLAKGLESLEIAAKAGVAMCYGSDLLGPLTREQSREFGIRAKVLSPKLVLQSATVNAARMLRQDLFLGQVKEAFAADFIILNKNPLENAAILDDPDAHMLAVIKDGRVYVSRWSKLQVDVEQRLSVIE